ncbi:pilus motility taxis protein HmpF [Gloeocapsa sp. PCC 73106]|uniref:pilus motility taxis protein HmpF n=1 Tax=Gloeocapsa sp. PCC 73106 TaxID=102232 RepID=UPI0002ACD4CA|nr:pilus motility taxis protein HmpF [Gloeocapsa sp. PCC 73106]ELR96387.1 hypothetical protein GLO73106DRAFT_00001790 [Gloeocapsa sp. PCC 73106]
MLYLAEVKKQTKGLIGGLRTELKLLAFQRDDQTWNIVPNEELVSCEYVNSVGEGALVFVNLNSNREVQGNPELGGTRVVRILQYFSRMLEKAQEEQEAIDNWKESLTYQGQELGRRREELEAQIQEIAAKEEELTNLEQKSQEIASAQRQLEEYQQRIESASPAHILGQEQIDRIKGLIGNLSSAFRGTDCFWEKLELIFRNIQTQDEYLRQQWGELERRRHEANDIRNQVEQQVSQLRERQQELSSTQKTLEHAKIELEKQQKDLQSKEERLGQIAVDLRNAVELKNNINILLNSSPQKHYNYPINNLESLEQLSLQELNSEVDKLGNELQKWTTLVNDQEEELNSEAQSVVEIEQKFNEAEESQKAQIGQELADAQERRKMMEVTLQGQRRNVDEKKDTLAQYQELLQRRQIFGPSLSILEEQYRNLEQEKQRLESEVEYLRGSLSSIREMIEEQTGINQVKERELAEQSESSQQLQRESALLQGRVETYEGMLQPWQSQLNELRERLIQMQQFFVQIAGEGEQPGWFGELEQVLRGLGE